MHPTVTDSLLAAAALGPFFRISPAGSRDASQSWRPLTDLQSAAGRDVLTAQMAVTSTLLGTDDMAPSRARLASSPDRDRRVEPRTVASILHLGAAAALCSPLLAIAAVEGHVPELSASHLDFCYPARGPLQLALNGAPLVRAKNALLPELADQLVRVALDGLLEPFTQALTAIEPVPEPTLAGNAFSSLAAAAILIAPLEAGQRARAIVDLAARRSPLLRDAGDLHWQQPCGHEYFRRRNCCLFYRIPGAGTCGDCILD